MESSVDSIYSWVVCFASFFVNMVLDGTLFSFGLFYVELRDYFQCSESQAALPGSLMYGMTFMAGPMVSVVVNRFGCRAATTLGGIVSAAGLICSSLSTRIEVLVFFYGIVGGIGMSLLFIPSLMIVSLYFKEKRALANGIATCGSGVGTVVFSFLVTWLVAELSWRSLIQLLAGLVIQCVVCGVLYRPMSAQDSVCSSPADVSDFNEVNCELKSGELLLPERTKSHERVHTLVTKLTFSSASYGNLKEVADEMREQKLTLSSRNESQDLRKTLLMGEIMETAPFKPFRSKSEPSLQLTDNLKKHPLSVKSHLLRPLDRKDIFYSGSIMRIPHSVDLSSVGPSKNSLYLEKVEKPCIRTIVGLIDCSLMANKSFVAIVLSCTLWTGQGVFLTFMAPLALSRGTTPSNVSWLYCSIGLSVIVGRIASGWITDHPVVNSVQLYSGALLFAGVISMALPFLPSFVAHVTCCTLFGLCLAVYASLRTIVLVDVLGIDKLTHSLGILATFQGIGFSVMPPLAGCLLSTTSSFITPFIFIGVCFALAGVICLPLKTLPVIPDDITPSVSVETDKDNTN